MTTESLNLSIMTKTNCKNIMPYSPLRIINGILNSGIIIYIITIALYIISGGFNITVKNISGNNVILVISVVKFGKMVLELAGLIAIRFLINKKRLSVSILEKRGGIDHLKKKVPSALLAIVFFQLTLFVFGPLNLYNLNIEEFSASIFSLLRYLIIPLALLTVFYVLICGLLVDRFSKKIISLTLVLSFLLWFQGNCLVWNYGIFDGKEIDWSKNHIFGIIDIGVWILCLVLGWKFSTKFAAKARFIALFFIFIQFSSLLWNVYNNPDIIKTKPNLIKTNQSEKASSSIFSFSKERNIVLIVLDTFASPAFDSIINKKPKWKERFNDFIYFKNTLGSFPTTKPSIPAILTGRTYDNSVPFKNYIKKVFSDQSLPSVLYENGYQVDIAMLAADCRFIQSTSCTSPNHYSTKNLIEREKMELARLLDVVLFRYLPHFGKILVYNDHSWFLQHFSFGKRKGQPHHLNAISLAKSVENYSRIGNAKATFKIFHLYLPHPPIQRNEKCQYTEKLKKHIPENFDKQAECALSLATKIINKMKSLDVYDQSMILILADHGTPYDYPHYYRSKKGYPSIGRALPLLLIKPFNRRGDLAISEVPASLTDIPRTISDTLGMEWEFPGLSLFDLKPGQMRERYYRDYKWEHKYWKKNYLPNMREYSVMGHAWSLTSWRRLETVFNPSGQ